MIQTLEKPVSYIGEFRTFGHNGVAYEILDEIDNNTVVIRVVESGETLEYAVQKLLNDPEA